MKRILHQNTYGDISSLPLCAPLKGAEVFRNTKGTDMQACVHAEIDKSFIALRSWQKLCLCCHKTTFFSFSKTVFFHVHSGRESDLIKKHKIKSCASLFILFKAVWLPLFCGNS